VAVRHRRLQLGLSVRTLAAQAGFTPSFISQIEHGQASPSIASLDRIAAALGLSLGRFFDATTSAVPTITRPGDRARIDSRWSQATIEALARHGGGFEPLMITLAPGGSSGCDLRQHASPEFALVFEGRLTLTLGSDDHELSRGDAVLIPAETPHRWENRSPHEAQVLTMASPGRR
jgi:XRE family transcriptional regulator, regulator of sulfur utilization